MAPGDRTTHSGHSSGPGSNSSYRGSDEYRYNGYRGSGHYINYHESGNKRGYSGGNGSSSRYGGGYRGSNSYYRGRQEYRHDYERQRHSRPDFQRRRDSDRGSQYLYSSRESDYNDRKRRRTSQPTNSHYRNGDHDLSIHSSASSSRGSSIHSSQSLSRRNSLHDGRRRSNNPSDGSSWRPRRNSEGKYGNSIPTGPARRNSQEVTKPTSRQPSVTRKDTASDRRDKVDATKGNNDITKAVKSGLDETEGGSKENKEAAKKNLKSNFVATKETKETSKESVKEPAKSITTKSSEPKKADQGKTESETTESQDTISEKGPKKGILLSNIVKVMRSKKSDDEPVKKQVEKKKPDLTEVKAIDDKSEDSDYTPEDAPVPNGKRRSAIVEESDSEEETDIDSSIPAPSRRTRHLHRLLGHNSQEITNQSESENESDVKSEIEEKDEGEGSEKHARSSSHSRRNTGRHGKDASGRSLLQRICARGNYEEAKKLIESGSDVNDADYAGNTPLHEAALEGYTKVAGLLLDNGADVNRQSGQMDKDTPLIDAATNLHLETVKLLIERGADPTIINAQGDCALDAIEDQDDEEELDESEKATSDELKKILIKYTKEWRKKHQDTNRKGSGSPTSEVEDSIAQRRNNNTFFDFFTREGRSEIYTKVIENDVTYVLNYVSNLAANRVPLDLLPLAAKHGHTDIASLLLAFGAKVNYRDENGRTPLMYAVGKNHIEMVKLLLENNADSSLKDHSGRTALDYARTSALVDDEEIQLLKDGKIIPKKEESEEEEKQEPEEEVERKEVKKAAPRRIRKRESKAKKTNTAKKSKQLKKKTLRKVEKKSESESRSISRHASISSPIDTAETTEAKPARPKLKRKRISVHIDSLSASPDAQIPVVKRRKTVEVVGGTGDLNKTVRSRESSESQSRSVTPIAELSEEARKARKERIAKAEKAREALEMERQEHKRLRQQQIAKSIEQMEKKRAEEEAKEKAKQEEKEKKLERANLKMKEALEKKKEAAEQEKASQMKKLIRSYYPYGLKVAEFGKIPLKAEMMKYLPLYSFNVDGKKYLTEVQVCLLLGAENLGKEYPELKSVTSIQAQYKPLLWNLLWPMIGSFLDRYSTKIKGTDEMLQLQKLYENEEKHFFKLEMGWVDYTKFVNLINSRPDLHDLQVAVGKTNICPVKFSKDLGTNPVAPTSLIKGTPNGGIDKPEDVISSNTTSPVLRKKTEKLLQLISKRMW